MLKLGGERYTGLHKIFINNTENISKFSELIEKDKCNIFNRIKVLRQIGSDSAYATIWESDVNLSSLQMIKENSQLLKIAIKVQKNIEKTLEEISINNFLKQWPDYFLIMYDHIYCEKISTIKEQFSGEFIFMELAIADLHQFLKYKKVTENELLTIVSQVFDSIKILGSNQIFHGDLHIRNIFIVPRHKTIRAVIGDFGESMGIDSITSHTSDIYKFCTSLLEGLVNGYPKTIRRLKQVLTYTNGITSKLESDYETFLETDPELEEIDEYFAKTVSNTIENVQKILLN